MGLARRLLEYSIHSNIMIVNSFEIILSKWLSICIPEQKVSVDECIVWKQESQSIFIHQRCRLRRDLTCVTGWGEPLSTAQHLRQTKSPEKSTAVGSWKSAQCPWKEKFKDARTSINGDTLHYTSQMGDWPRASPSRDCAHKFPLWSTQRNAR